MNNAGAGPARAELLALLDQQIAAMDAVLSCLKIERDALESRDLDQLVEITEQKNASLIAVNRIDQQRRTLTSDAENAGGDGHDADMVQRKQRLGSLVEACREINDANGSMIRTQSRRVDNTLRFLRGDRGDAVVYGPKGEPGQRTNPQTLLTSV
jgi:flagella synthesis protein FlgN